MASMSRDPTLIPSGPPAPSRILSTDTLHCIDDISKTKSNNACTKSKQLVPSSASTGSLSDSDSDSLDVVPQTRAEACTSRKQLESSGRRWPSLRAIGKYWSSDIREDLFLEIELLILAFLTGIQDAATYPDFKCFASNQTGNTVLLAAAYAGLVDPEAFVFRNTWISLGAFVAGALIAGQVTNWLGKKRRATCFVSSLIQTTLVILSTVIDYIDAAQRHQTTSELKHNFTWQTVGGRPFTPLKRSGLGILSFASGAQVAMARAVGINEITTAMATSAYVDLVVDPRLMSLSNRPRNRRVAFLVSLIAGSFGGAYASRAFGLHFAILVSAVGKVIVTLAFLFNKQARRPVVRDGEAAVAAAVSQKKLKD